MPPALTTPEEAQGRQWAKRTVCMPQNRTNSQPPPTVVAQSPRIDATILDHIKEMHAGSACHVSSDTKKERNLHDVFSLACPSVDEIR